MAGDGGRHAPAKLGAAAPRGPGEPLTLVLDATVAVPACTVPDGFARYADEELVAPPLLWSEARSVLHKSVWRGIITRAVGQHALERLERAPIRARLHRRLGFEAWRIADELGWARTYDAEYLALARLLDARLVTLDGGQKDGAERLGVAVAPL